MASASTSSKEIAAAGGVFYLSGDDEFRKQRHADRLVQAHLDPSTRDFNYDVLRGSEVDLETLASVLGTPPMMAEWRVVLLRETEGLASSARARELLIRTATSPPPGLALILLVRVPAKSKARFYRDLARLAQSHEFRSLRREDAPGWLMAWTRKSYGREMSPDAATALVSGVGTDLGTLDREAAKLAAFVGDGGTITLDAVKQAGIQLPTQDRWAWFNLVGRRRFREALAGLPVLLAQGESGVGLVIALGGHLLRLGVAVSAGPRALEQALPGHQRWQMKELRSQAGGWTSAEIDTALLGLRRVDRLLKASSFSDAHLLEEWLLARIHERERAA